MALRCILAGLALAAAFSGAPASAQTHEPKGLARACQSGDGFSCANLAVLYRHGMNVEQDYPTALTLFVAACEDGVDFACGSIGEMTYLGYGINQDRDAGATLMRGACARGNEWSCRSLRRLDLPRQKPRRGV